MKTFIFTAKNISITVTISSENKEDSLREIQQYFENYGIDDLRLLENRERR